MVYRGSKKRIMKHIKPIIEEYLKEGVTLYVEPFVGGANSIDKISFPNKIGYDNHYELIALLNKLKTNTNSLPQEVDFDKYSEVRANPEKFPPWYVGVVGFGASYGGRYFDGGYGRNSDKSSVYPQRLKNMIEQAPHLSGITFEYISDYKEIVVPQGEKVLFYCDPPYRDTKKYSTSKDFNYDAFYDWCRNMSRAGHIVVISEYWMPEDFQLIWSKEVSMLLKSERSRGESRTECLFILKQ